MERGDVVLDPLLHAPADRIDARVRILATEPKPIGLYTDKEEAEFWQGVRQSPTRTARDVRSKMRDIDRRLSDFDRQLLYIARAELPEARFHTDDERRFATAGRRTGEQGRPLLASRIG